MTSRLENGYRDDTSSGKCELNVCAAETILSRHRRVIRKVRTSDKEGSDKLSVDADPITKIQNHTDFAKCGFMQEFTNRRSGDLVPTVSGRSIYHGI